MNPATPSRQEITYRNLMAHLFEAQALAITLWGADFEAVETLTSAIDEAVEQHDIDTDDADLLAEEIANGLDTDEEDDT